MRKGNLFVISGPSGAGKGTLVNRLMQNVPDAWLSISATTRQPRGQEVDGVHYRFLSVAQFEQMIDESGFFEWAKYGDNYYGTPRDAVDSHIAEGNQVILEIDVQGGFQVKELLPEAHLIFIQPPSMEVLEFRLRGRGTDSEESIAKRLDAAQLEMQQAAKYDIQLVNDDLDDATEKLIGIVDRFATE